MSKIYFKTVDMKKLNQNHKDKIELKELKDWFNTYYTVHVQKYNRLIALNQLDKGEDPNTKLADLYTLAESKRARINEIEDN